VSHFTKVATKINNLVALMKALENLKMRYTYNEQGVEVMGYRGQTTKAEVSIHMGKYDIGVVKAEDGNYTLVADWWGVETTVGKMEQEIVEELDHEYAYVRVLQACEEQGYQIAREDIQTAEDGTIQLLATKWG
jgi:hypothetical protein